MSYHDGTGMCVAGTKIKQEMLHSDIARTNVNCLYPGVLIVLTFLNSKPLIIS